MTSFRFFLTLLLVGVGAVSVTTASQHASWAQVTPACPMMQQMVSGSMSGMMQMMMWQQGSGSHMKMKHGMMWCSGHMQKWSWHKAGMMQTGDMKAMTWCAMMGGDKAAHGSHSGNVAHAGHQATGAIHAALGTLSMTELHTLKASVEEKLHMLQQTQSPDKATRAQIRMYKQLLRRIEKHLSTM